jgi:hypothetical protein
MLKMPARLRMTVKTSVDKPKIMASVAAIERRSFQMLMVSSSMVHHECMPLITFLRGNCWNGCWSACAAYVEGLSD